MQVVVLHGDDEEEKFQNILKAENFTGFFLRPNFFVKSFSSFFSPDFENKPLLITLSKLFPV